MDETLAELQRRFRETGSEEDERAWLLARTRLADPLSHNDLRRLARLAPGAAMGVLRGSIESGELSLECVELAAVVGEPIARRYLAEFKTPGAWPLLTDVEFEHVRSRLYLSLLRLTDPSSVRNVGRAIARRPDPHADIIHLFQQQNWRDHLVAAVGLLGSAASAPCLEELWGVMETTFVSPQCASVAFLLDPDFLERARVRVKALAGRNAKARSALIALIQRHSKSHPAVDSIPTRPEAMDPRVRGDRFALRWLDRVETFRRFLDSLDDAPADD